MNITHVTRYPFRPGTCVDFIGSPRLLSAYDFGYLAPDVSLVRWPVQLQRNLLVFGPDIIPDAAILAAQRMNVQTVMAESDAVTHLLAMQAARSAHLPPIAPYMHNGQSICLEGTSARFRAKIGHACFRLGIELTTDIEAASALIVGEKATVQRSEQRRARAQARSVPIVDESEFVTRDLERAVSDQRWRELAERVQLFQDTTSRDALVAWRPQTRFQLAL